MNKTVGKNSRVVDVSSMAGLVRNRAATRQANGAPIRSAAFDWLRKYRAIGSIVVAALVAGAVISLAEVEAREPLITVLTGGVLVASLAIFAAAIAAAIYAKPAYDQAIKLLQPVTLELEEIIVRDSGQEIEPVREDADGNVIYEVNGRLPVLLKVWVRFKNIGVAQSECIFNFRVPAACELCPLDDPIKRHYLTSETRVYPFTSALELESKLSAAVSLLQPDIDMTYSVGVTIPDREPPSASGWPMLMLVRGANDRALAINEMWWIACRT